MEAVSLMLSSIIFFFFLLVSYFVGSAFYSIWWKPKAIEKLLHRQGFRGNAYRLLYGDSKEEREAFKKAWSRPMDGLDHRIAARIIPFVYQTIERYGKSCLIWAGPIPRVVVADPNMVKEVLADRSGQFKKPPSNPLTRILATGVAVLNGKEWARRRKIVNSAFHPDKLKEMVPSIVTSCSDLVKKWDGLAGSEGCCELEVWTEFQALTGDVISRTAFGSSFEDGKRIFQLQNEQAKLAIEAARSPYIPGFRFIPTTKNKRRWLLDHRIKSMVRAIIDRKSESLQQTQSLGSCSSSSSSSSDLLTVLLELSRDEEEKGISIDDVVEECKLFYLVGHETTASLLTWTLVLLSVHPSWQHRARDEVLRLCRKDAPDLDCISQLKIVPMILYEVLRLYPSIVSLTRRTEKETKLGEFTFPVGVDLLLPVILIHHDSKHWGEDAEEFNPERFSNGVSKTAAATTTTAAAKDGRNVFYYPFGWGPRTCLGQNFAMMQAKMALALILQHFAFELSPSYSHAPYTVITLQPLHGAHIILRRL